MPPPRSEPPPPRRAAGGPIARLIAAIAVVGMAVVIFYVVKNVRSGASDAARPMFDPSTTNPDELRRVTEAVSRIIAAPPGRPHEEAVETLESLRVESAGARDLKESCVNTYRGTIRAEQMLHEVASLIGGPDGGQLRADQIPPAASSRAVELQHQMEEQIEIVNQSKDRCLDLYIEATRTMGITPARRP